MRLPLFWTDDSSWRRLCTLQPWKCSTWTAPNTVCVESHWKFFFFFFSIVLYAQRYPPVHTHTLTSFLTNWASPTSLFPFSNLSSYTFTPEHLHTPQHLSIYMFGTDADLTRQIYHLLPESSNPTSIYWSITEGEIVQKTWWAQFNHSIITSKTQTHVENFVALSQCVLLAACLGKCVHASFGYCKWTCW